MDTKSFVEGGDRLANNLLAALTADDYAHLRPLLEKRELPAGATIFEPGDIIHYAHFPCGQALASCQVVMADNREIETALVGREGAVGGIVSNGRLPAYARATVRNEGAFYRIALKDLEQAKAQSPTLHNLFTRYADCLMAQIFQATACNAAHSIEARSAKWMLANVDRTNSAVLTITQEQIAAALGVGRSYASRVLQKLRHDGLVRLARGRIVVEDCDRLRRISCDCDDLVRHHFETVLAGVYPMHEGDPAAAAPDTAPPSGEFKSESAA